MLEWANEVQEVLGRSYGLPEDVDEDDLEAGKRRFRCFNQKCFTHAYIK